jgi:radical SAM enzyme (TIGR01210 family)
MKRQELRNQIREYIMGLRDQARLQHKPKLVPLQLKNVVFTESRKGYLNGEYVDRYVLFLRGTGCSWVTQTGGCTFCGFWDATNFGDKIDDADTISQVVNVINDDSLGFDNYPIICLYNDGSLLVEGEVGLDAVSHIFDLISRRPHVERIVIEAKIIDITEEKISRLVKQMNSKELEVAVGFESAEEIVRDLCINKNFSNDLFSSKAKVLKDYGASLVPLVMIKPPFLSESQAIEDAVKTLCYLDQFGFQRIDLELATVEDHTILHSLWNQGLYYTPWLWSVIEILRRAAALNLKTPVFISPTNYTATAKEYTSNCSKCDPLINRAIEEYNKNLFDVSVFDHIDCECKVEWLEEVKTQAPAESMQNQIERIFKELLSREGSRAGEEILI